MTDAVDILSESTTFENFFSRQNCLVGECEGVSTFGRHWTQEMDGSKIFNIDITVQVPNGDLTKDRQYLMFYIGVGNLNERTESFTCWFDESVLEYSCNSSHNPFSLTSIYNWKPFEDKPFTTYPNNRWIEGKAVLRKSFMVFSAQRNYMQEDD